MRHLFFLLSMLSVVACTEKDPSIVGDGDAASSYLLVETDLPEYEHHLDHRALMANWTEEFYHKGMVTYRTVCFNCHGNEEQPGSMPNAAKFWKDKLKNGSDPYAMYQTLTRGFGLMPPQVRLTPQEKYEVIHFIREEFMKEQNPEQYTEITDDWLNSLPAGDTIGPDPQPYQPWAEMDYGNFLMRTYDLSSTGDPDRGISGGRSPLPNEDFRDVNFAYKGIAIRLDAGAGGVAAGNAFVLFDHDLMRFTGFWTGKGFIDYEDILLNDRHNIFPRTVGQVQIENPITPGWANPASGSFDDPRFVAVDGRPFGPLPKEWTHYEGLYYHESRVVIQYTVGEARILETYDLEANGADPVISRTLNVNTPAQDLTMRIVPSAAAVLLLGDGELATEDGFHILKLKAGQDAKVKILISTSKSSLKAINRTAAGPEDLTKYTQGGPAHYPQVITSPIIRAEDDAAYVEDVFVLPLENPWKSRMRPTGIDFLEDPDQAVVSTIDGEVWRLEGISQAEGMIKWHRIATGLFQPLGIKYHNGKIYVSCRDQIAVLEDLNGDGETDYYRSFNNDHQVTEHFHEFAMGLQVDKAGNFYYAKSGRHARTALVPQHGTLIRVSPDGEQSEIIANGFRAANGVCINPDGSFIVTDQEGYWNPMNRINWVEEGGFYGNMYGYGAPADTSDAAMLQPLCWIDSKYDRSPAELLWADSKQWGPLNGSLLSLSYGYGKMFAVLPQKVGDIRQAGIVEVPVPQFPTGLMRGRFHPADGQFYGCGMSAWATNQMIQVGGLYRVRYTGLPLHLPVTLAATQTGIELTFSDPLDKASAENPANFEITTWDLKRSHNYGSKRYNVQQLKISKAKLDEDGKLLRIALPDIQPTWVMEIKYHLEATDGKPVEGIIQNTIYTLEKTTALDM
ncbi:MAG: DUF6797 domain-containing protein [Saprospiraceae bacterium]|nr:c-type cytochrome [Lewinella sp.]